MIPRLFPEYLDGVDGIWAKSSPDNNKTPGESLPRHSWNTVARMADLARLRPTLPVECGEPRMWHRLFWACLLHDFGKSAKGFQTMLRTGERWKLRHEVLSLAFVDWLFLAGNPDRRWVVAAVASHHKDWPKIVGIEGYIDDDAALSKMVDEVSLDVVVKLWRWLNECTSDWIVELNLEQHGVEMLLLPTYQYAVDAFRAESVERIRAALSEYRDWVESGDEQRLAATTVVPQILMRGYIMQSDHTASAHTPSLPELSLNLEGLLLAWQSKPLPDKIEGYKHHQRESATQIGSALLIAPTGSGKTEAALLWAACQKRQPGGLSRLFYTLPYQASMNAMHQRLKEVFPDQQFEGETYELAGLQHGRSLLSLYRKAMEKYPEDKPYRLERAAREAKWLKNLVKLNYPPVRVFSPYQLLKGFYRLKGYEILLADYYDSAFIFDEIHAYEVNRLALILKSVEYLAKHYRARFLFMSATFPDIIKDKIKQALGGKLPCITADRNTFENSQRHTLRLRNGDLTDDPVLAEIVAEVGKGKAVLVCVNTVKRAQALYKKLALRVQALHGEIVLLHGRFNGTDRLAKEKAIEKAVGVDNQDALEVSVGKRQGILVVATQAIEVSLNIDLDVLYTDPAPLEALVQRFGRINRRGTKGLADVFVFREPHDGQGVYSGKIAKAALKHTLLIVEKEQNKPIDESKIGDWLNQIYKDQIAEDWAKEYQETADEYEEVIVDRLCAFDSASDELEQRFDSLFDGVEVLPYEKEGEYNEKEREGSLDTPALLVPVSFGQYMGLRNKDRIREREGGKKKWPPVTMAEYSSEFGLQLQDDGE